MFFEKELLRFLYPAILSAAALACSAGGPRKETADTAGGKAPWLEPGSVRPDNEVFRRIKKAVDGIRIIDTHEHLISEQFYLELPEYSLFNWFRQPWFPQYSGSDLVSAGMPPADLEALKDPAVPPAERWAKASPWWPFAMTTGFGQALRIAVRDIYGLPDLNDSTWQELCRRMQEARKPGFYKKVLYDMAGMDLLILDQIVLEDSYAQSSFVAADFKPRAVLVKRFDDTFIRLSQASLAEIGGHFGRPVETLDDLLAALDKEFEGLAARGCYVGVKCALAYDREIRFENVPRETAEKIFNRLVKGDLPFEERRPFEDYMLHQVVRRVGQHGLVMQIHTGMLAGPEGGNVTQTSPTLLYNLFKMYPETRFSIFHGSFPYMGELAVLAKNFPNVYLDNAWMPIISPSATREWMHRWIETVPLNKIQGFGGDYIFPEGSYGHSLVARQILAEVLAEKVQAGYFSEREAVWAARIILRDNAVELFGLKRFLE